nr:MAG TPA: hypothetical protein [Caudoviricetes sp.]
MTIFINIADFFEASEFLFYKNLNLDFFNPILYMWSYHNDNFI